MLEKGKYSTSTIHEALFEAIKENRPSSVQLLLNSKIPFPLWALHSSLELDAQICDILTTELVKRRTSLRNLAETILPIEELTRLGVSREQLPDGNWNSICTALKARGVVVPNEIYTEESSWDNTSSVFGQTSCLRLMKCLHLAGFRSMCRLAPPTPNHLEGVLDRAIWLIEMGLDLKFSEAGLPAVLELWPAIVQGFASVAKYGLIPGSPPTCNRVCQKVSKSLGNLNVRQQQFLRESLASNELDDCSCACSPDDGCRSITIALKEVFRLGNLYSASVEIFGSHTCFRDHIMEYLFRDQSESFGFVLAVLRFLTFNELKLTHTCHRSHNQQWGAPVSGDEAAETHEEERLLLQELDILVSEFQQKYLELRIPLPDFIHGYWAERMKKILSRRERADAQIVQEARQVGVWLDWEPVDRVELVIGKPCRHATTV